MKTCNSCGKLIEKPVYCNSTCRMRVVRGGAHIVRHRAQQRTNGGKPHYDEYTIEKEIEVYD